MPCTRVLRQSPIFAALALLDLISDVLFITFAWNVSELRLGTLSTAGLLKRAFGACLSRSWTA